MSKTETAPETAPETEITVDTVTETVHFPASMDEVATVETVTGVGVQIEWSVGSPTICLNLSSADHCERIGVYLNAKALRSALQRIENPNTATLVLSNSFPEHPDDGPSAWAVFPVRGSAGSATMFGLWVGESRVLTGDPDGGDQFDADLGLTTLVDASTLNALVETLTAIEGAATAYALLKFHLRTHPTN